MKVWKRVAVALSIVGCLCGCGTTAPATEPALRTHTIYVRSVDGQALEGVRVSAGDAAAVTDSAGRAVLMLPEETESVTLSQVPLGYDGQLEHPLGTEVTRITLCSRPIPPEQGSPTSLGLGDIMYDLTLETTQGPLTLSQVLREKDVVLLQFWYSDCIYCARTFSSLEVACSSYDEQVQVIAVDPLEKQEVVEQYQSQRGYSFPMAACPSSWRRIFGVDLYPSTFVIDRYGRICLIHWGALTNTEQIRGVLDAFVGDGYVQQVYDSVEEIWSP
ncbi:MAG: TlpA family protein disulfide reductase [Oscillospiraceae bacterium]|nr:TlpA family protein disulfide reductase [Oscillospiraceae bacterium]